MPDENIAAKKWYDTDGIHIARQGRENIIFPLGENTAETIQALTPQADLWNLLGELWQGNLLRLAAPGEWVIPWQAMDHIAEEDKQSVFQTLGIPEPGTLDMRVTSQGSVANDTFRAHVEIHHPTRGTIRDGDFPHVGPAILLSRDAILLLTPEQQHLLDSVRSDGVDWASVETRMAYLAHVKAAAKNAGARVDAYIESEDYEFATQIDLDLRGDAPDKITLIPHIPNIDQFDPTGGRSLLNGRPPTVLTRRGTGLRRRRMILSKSVKEKLAQLPLGGEITGANVPRFLSNPEQILPEGFDLSHFSERVKGIKTKVYNSRPYIHVKKSETGGWFEGVPGIDLDDWSPGDEAGEAGGKIKGLSPETYRELARKAKENGEEYVQWGDDWVRINPDEADRYQGVLDGMTPQGDGTFRIPAGSILEIYENLELLEFCDPKSLAGQKDEQLPTDLPGDHPPERFNGRLYPHQLDGYRWLTRLGMHQIGGLLADDMGLGKTIQVIAHMLRLKDQGKHGPHLTVVPKTLIENWSREIRKFSDNHLSVFVYDAATRWPGREGLRGIDVVLTTYDTLRRDQVRLATVDWNMVICDEAQYAKNPTAQRTCAVKALKSKHRAALTGTPVENGLIEFWCIMDFVQPGLLGSWADFRTTYERPIIEADAGRRDELVTKLLGELRGHYLRRLKSEILGDLPPKQPQYRPVTLEDQQYQLYREIARRGKMGGKGTALGAIQRLIMLCAHPAAVATQGGFASYPDYQFPKINETIKILTEIKAADEKVVIFTDFKLVQHHLQDAIRKTFGIWPDIINGELTQNRQRVIDIFSEKPGFNAIILGHQVGGVGLNITAANHVIHYTRPWNPAKENQATDRTHRIGQTKPVSIYYPIVKDERFKTVEERLDELIRSKEDLARDVLRPSAEMKVQIEELLDCLDAA